MAKKITPRKKIAPRITKVIAAAPRVRKVTEDSEPEELKRLIKNMLCFIRAVCVNALEYDEQTFNPFGDEKAPLNLNEVHDKILALKSDRDAWRTRCESIEAAFNTVSLGSEFAPAATPEKAQV